MLSVQDNEDLCRVGKGTPVGDLMRQYWLPAVRADELPAPDCPPVRIKLLGEELIAFRATSGAVGLVKNACPHRGASLSYGRVEKRGIACAYHGWLFSAGGKCLEQPMEPPDSAFNEKIQITSYPVQEMGGLVWAYLGPLPAPLLPEWDLIVRPDGYRQILAHWLPCNWLKVMENQTTGIIRPTCTDAGFSTSWSAKVGSLTIPKPATTR